jgi:hypothetical protein
MNPFSSVTDWSFLNEPLYRWFIFFGALLFIALAWKHILEYMK